ncbi:MAG: hypothetical protein JNK15_04310, partial [Planctomycetes bacterium]|nr:hypothetical protein [Planctomycetota bacterium]
LANVLELPGPWFEAFGIAAAAALLAPWRGQPVLAKVLRWQIALQVAAICTFVVRRRFFLSCAVPVVALAALAIARLRGRWRTAALGAAVASGLAFAWNGRIDADRAVDRDLGVWLRPQSGPAAAVCSELPRVTWFAGARPGLPRRFTPAQWLEQAAPPEVRWLVLAERTRAEFTAAEVAALERRFRPAAMPQSLQGAVEGRRIFVFERR